MPASADRMTPHRAGSTSSARAKSHWQVHFRREIQEIQARYALKIKALSQQAKIDPSTARRIIDQRFKHMRSRNGWNAYQAWVKHEARETAEQTEGPAPTEGPAATEGPAPAPSANDIDEPKAPASAAKRDVGAAYEALTPANKQAIDKWATKRLDEKPACDTQKEFSAACCDVMTRIGRPQLQYGIMAVAFLSHSQDGIDPFLGHSDEAGVALASALNRLKTGTTGNDETYSFFQLLNTLQISHTFKTASQSELVLTAVATAGSRQDF